MKKKLKKILVLGSLIAIPSYINHIIFKNSKKHFENNQKHYNWIFGNIRYICKGIGEPVLLIHDLKSGSGIHEWEKNIEYLSKYYKVYAIDLLGYGFSDKPDISYNSYLYTSLITSFIKNVIKQKTNVIANGNSSTFALMSHILNDNYINKFILISPTTFETNGIYPTYIDLLKRVVLETPLIGTSIYNFLNSKFMLKRQIKKLTSSTNKNHLVNNFYEYAHGKGSNSKVSYAASLTNFLNCNIKSHSKKLNIPIHIIWGALDEINPIENYNKINDFSPTITLTVFEDAKSLPHVENPLAFYKICKNFFTEVA